MHCNQDSEHHQPSMNCVEAQIDVEDRRSASSLSES